MSSAVHAALSTHAFVSDFCERVGPGLWAEPLNVGSSLAFVVGAVWLARDIARAPAGAAGGRRWSLALLAACLGFMGAGSMALHTLATGWGASLDMLAIRCFLLWFVTCFLRWMMGWSWPWALLGMPGLYLLAEGWLRLGGPEALFGLHAYLPALWTLLACTLALAARGDPAWRLFALAAVSHGASLAFHRLDGELCRALPLGTHFIWHLFNAALCFAVARCVTRRALDRLEHPGVVPAGAPPVAG
ncbi:hypothetical protein [Caldimonas brevitalea]|uniref:Arginine/ornithine antiporter ArcD n=1 Tax=Caldimonas brevitalea TaxID=413882 RepID=A0A0G3BRH8_9BURK|nr:hypothetical protein [Caldimonas brevitalea]AKJ30588.1 arginine/ornithine antiporter ArcD [Caldimonas brevitalea]